MRGGKLLFLKYLPTASLFQYCSALRKSAGVKLCISVKNREATHGPLGNSRFCHKNSLSWALFFWNSQTLKVNFIHILLHNAIFMD